MIPALETLLLVALGAVFFLVIAPGMVRAWCEVDELLEHDPEAGTGQTPATPTAPAGVGGPVPACGPRSAVIAVPVDEIERERAYRGLREGRMHGSSHG